MTETDDRLAGTRTRRGAKAPNRGKGLKIKRVFTTAGVHPYDEVGLAILRPLRELDEVAYLRFASVYRSFTSVADFEKEIAELKARQSSAAEPSEPVSSGAAPRA